VSPNLKLHEAGGSGCVPDQERLAAASRRHQWSMPAPAIFTAFFVFVLRFHLLNFPSPEATKRCLPILRHRPSLRLYWPGKFCHLTAVAASRTGRLQQIAGENKLIVRLWPMRKAAFDCHTSCAASQCPFSKPSDPQPGAGGDHRFARPRSRSLGGRRPYGLPSSLELQAQAIILRDEAHFCMTPTPPPAKRCSPSTAKDRTGTVHLVRSNDLAFFRVDDANHPIVAALKTLGLLAAVRRPDLRQALTKQAKNLPFAAGR